MSHYRSYRIVKRLGEGAMGAVYQAIDEQTHVSVALKVAHEGKRRGELIAKLRHEADVLGRIVDDGVVRILDLFEDGDDFVLVMEYVDGDDILAWSRGRTVHEVLAMMARVCQAVAAVHAIGFIHLDLKPSNIMVMREQVKLLDFGTAWRLGGDPSTVPMGTPHFMSTEHARLKVEGSGRVDVRADLYALGVTLYTLCTGGALPFSAPEEALLATVVAFPPTDPRVYNPALPQPLVELLMRLLCKPARARHDDIAELRDAFLDLVSKMADAPLVPDDVTPVEVYQPPSPRQLSALMEGRFHILHKAGSGAFASVYEAVELASGRRCALKVLLAGAPGSAEDRRFQREAKALERLRHPNIAAYGTHFMREGVGFLTMEYVEGADLESFRGAPIEDIVWLGMQLCRGLQTAHDAHVIHRDLKPQNIRVTAEGGLKILDFGLSRLMDALSALTMTGSEFAGTLGYCAPESINARPNPRFDLFSSGVILYELVAGHMPYARGTEYINQYLRGEDPQPRPMERKIPPALKKILEGLIQFDPTLRVPATARELEQQLRDLGLTADREGAHPPMVAPGSGEHRRKPAPPLGEPGSEADDPAKRRRAGFDSGETIAVPHDRGLFDSGETSAVAHERGLFDSGETSAVAHERGVFDSGETLVPQARNVLDSSETAAIPSGVFDSGETSAAAQARGVFDSGETRIPQARNVLDSSETAAIPSGLFGSAEKSAAAQERGVFDSGETRIPQARNVLDSSETAAIPSGVFGSGEMPRPALKRTVRRFFGRADEIDEFLDFVHGGGAHGRVRAICGPAGIGRTRLLRAIGRLASASGRVRWVPVAVPAAVASGQSGSRQLERLLVGALQGRATSDAETLLRTLCASTTVVLALDDAHRLEPAAVDRLAALAASLEGRPFLIVAAFRTDRGADAARAAAFAERLSASLTPLPGLDAEACESLAKDRLGLPLSSSFAAALRARTAGNPTHLLSLLATAHLRAEGEDDPAPPRVLMEQVEDLIADLPLSAAHALRALILLNTPFPEPLAAAALHALGENDLPPTDPHDSLPAAEPLHRIPTPNPRDGSPAAEPPNGILTPEPGDGSPAEEPLNGIPAPDPREGSPTAEARDGIPAPDPHAGSPTAEARDGIPAPDPHEGSPTAEARDGIPAPDPHEGSTTAEARDGSPAPEPRNGNLTAEARDGLSARERPSIPVLEMLETLVEGGLLARDLDYDFPSPLFREAVQATLPPLDDAAPVHAAIARWLEDAARDTEAATHYEQAALPQEAVRCLARAGAREDSPLAHRIAALQRLTPLLEETEAPRSQLARSLIDCGALSRGRAPAEGLSLLHRGFAQAELSEDACTRVLARCELAKALQYADPSLAHRLIEQAIALLRPPLNLAPPPPLAPTHLAPTHPFPTPLSDQTPPPPPPPPPSLTSLPPTPPTPRSDAERWHLAYALAMRGHLLLRHAQSDPSRSAALREAAEAAWQQAEDELSRRSEADTLLPANLALGRGLQLQREQAFEAAREQFARAAHHAETGGHALQLALAGLNLLILVANGAGTPDEGRAVYEASVPLLKKLDDPLQLARVHRNYAVMLQERTSEWKDVEASYREATDIHRQLGPDLELYVDFLNLEEILLFQGRIEEAAPLLQETWQVESRSGALEHRHTLRFRQGLYHLMTCPPDLPQAETLLREALAISEATDDLAERPALEATLALCLSSKGGLTEEANRLLLTAIKRATDSSTTAARVHRIWGECLLQPPPQLTPPHPASPIATARATMPPTTAPGAAPTPPAIAPGAPATPAPGVANGPSSRAALATAPVSAARMAEAIHHFEQSLHLSVSAAYTVEEAYARTWLSRLLAWSPDPEVRAAADEHHLRARELRARLGAAHIPADRFPVPPQSPTANSGKATGS